MKPIVTETALKTEFWGAAIRTVALFLWNGFTAQQPVGKNNQKNQEVAKI